MDKIINFVKIAIGAGNADVKDLNKLELMIEAEIGKATEELVKTYEDRLKAKVKTKKIAKKVEE